MRQSVFSSVAAFKTGWILGLALWAYESVRAIGLIIHTKVGLSSALLGLGAYPIILGTLGLLLSFIPYLRKPNRFITWILFFLLSPLLVTFILPPMPTKLLLHTTQLPKLLSAVLLALLLAREAGRFASLFVRAGSIKTWVIALSILPLGAGALLFHDRGEPHFENRQEATAKTGTNLLLITVDTLRKDELSYFGGPPGSTPVLDSLASSGTVFANATSCAPWTLSSLATMMTGYYPSTTGVFTGITRLANGFPTLATLLRDNGFHTRAIGRNTWLRPQFGLSQGFDVYNPGRPVRPSPAFRAFLINRILRPFDAPPEISSSMAAKEVTDEACLFLEEQKGTPFFLWLHFNNVHAPYEPKGEFLPSVLGYEGPFLTSSGTVVRLRQGNRLDDEDRERLRNLYRGEIRYVDTQIRRVLSALRKHGLDHSTIVAFASDHGEEFWDHGSVMHGHTLHSELLNIPLLFSWPGRIERNRRDYTPCSLVDLMPTVADLLDLDPNPHLQGYSLFGEDEVTDRPQFAEALTFFMEHKSVSVGGWKLIHCPKTRKSKLFSLSTDPFEQQDVASDKPEIVAALLDTLDIHLRKCREESDRLSIGGAATTIQMTPRLREQLRAQGYIE